jgi:hypothetical protein
MNDIEALDAARHHLELTIHDLWVRCIGVGGHHNAHTLRSYLAGGIALSDFDHDNIVLALNEALHDLGGHRLRYRHT